MKSVLEREFAESRKKQIGDIYYDLSLRFEPKSDKYSGNCKIKFYLKNKGKGISFESISDIKKIWVNGKEAKYQRNGAFVMLEEGLEEGKENEIEVEYEAKYDHTGDGLHQFIDPEDGNEYIYSNFEPYDAHRMFPCFDQPDLKAVLKLTIEIPHEWESVSNELGTEEKKGDKKIVSFKETKKLSTYLFHLSLGKYRYFEEFYKGMRMRIYFRKSVEKYVPKEDIFNWTRQGLDFYSDFFDYPYPFDKYDQLFVPEFNSGAMENPGAITFSERYLVRHKPTRTDRAALANTLIHEMAHMWFGDLVTMKWWDDLWLNESFADFMAHFVMVKATEFTDAWGDFYVRKSWAYYQDQLRTTHPIAANAEDTDVAFSNFDGISYAKGASVLKQLLFYVGEENFRKGIRDYFKKYEWQNTELKDFLGCFEKACNQELKEWFDAWIKTTGVNSTLSNFDFSGEKIINFKIIQEPSKDNNLLRNHKTKIAFFYGGEPGVLNPEIIKEVNYSGSETKVENLNAPEKNFKFVLLNYEDWDYSKSKFDSHSMKNILENVNSIDNSLTRHVIYGSLWEIVKDAEFSPKEFFNLLIKNAPSEKDLLLLERMALKIKTILTYYANDKTFKDNCERLFELSLQMMGSDIDMDKKSVWFSLLNFSVTGVSDRKKADTLLMILNGEINFKNFEFDQDKRWNSIAVLNSIGHENANDILEKEMDVDKSDRGQKKAAVAKASSLKNKKEFWDMFLFGKEKSSDYLKDAMGGFYWRHQKENLREYIDLFLKDINSLFEKHDNDYLKHFFLRLFPGIYVEDDLLNKIKKHLEELGRPNKLLNKYLKEGLDDLERALKIIKKYE